jgi:hypothetical protein
MSIRNSKDIVEYEICKIMKWINPLTNGIVNKVRSNYDNDLQMYSIKIYLKDFKPLKTYQDLKYASNKDLIDFLREQIFIVLKKANMDKNIFVACFNEIIKVIEKRLE